MSTCGTTVRSSPARGRSARTLTAMRTELGMVAALLAAAGLAWWSTADRMAGMDAGPGTALGSVAGSRACGRR